MFIVISPNKKHDNDQDENNDDDDVDDAMFVDSINSVENDECEDNDFYVWDDHREGIWINPSIRRVHKTQIKITNQKGTQKEKEKEKVK